MSSIDVREVTGIETYVNDEDDDPNPGIIIDTRAQKRSALTSEEARALASELWERAAYFDDLTRKAKWVAPDWENDPTVDPARKE